MWDNTDTFLYCYLYLSIKVLKASPLDTSISVIQHHACRTNRPTKHTKQSQYTQMCILMYTVDNHVIFDMAKVKYSENFIIFMCFLKV